jgi:hypothetical protein
VGEVGLALRSFQVGVHLNPADQELRLEDLDWARHLIQQVRTPHTVSSDVSGADFVKSRILTLYVLSCRLKKRC